MEELNGFLCFSGVYRIRCKKNGKVYIGQSKRIYSRVSTHIGYFELGIEHPEMQVDYDKYGIDEFEWEIAKRCEPDLSVLLDTEGEILAEDFLDEVPLYNEIFSQGRGKVLEPIQRHIIRLIKGRGQIWEQYYKNR